MSTDTRYAETSRGTLVPLLIDAQTNRPRNLDLEVTPHLLISGNTGTGATSALRLMAAHTAAHGFEVQVISLKRHDFRGLEEASGVTVHRDQDDVAEAAGRFVSDLSAELENPEFSGPPERRRLLVVDGLGFLGQTLVGSGADRRPLPEALTFVALMGRAAGYHLAASVRPHQLDQLPRAFSDCSAVLTLGPVGNKIRHQLMGPEERTPGVPAGPGGGELSEYSGPRAVRTVFCPEDEAWPLFRGR